MTLLQRNATKGKTEELLHLKVFPLTLIVFIRNMVVVADSRLFRS